MYRRYAGLFFCAAVDQADNELATLEALHFFVEVLDAFFGNVCELDLVFNFYKVCMRGGLGAEVVRVWGKCGGWRGNGESSDDGLMFMTIGLCHSRRGVFGG